MKHQAAAIVVVLVLIFGGQRLGAQAGQGQVLVSAAASLTDVLTRLAPDLEQSIHAGVLFNFGGSGALRRQIEEGAPVDLFFSASTEDMDRLQRAGLIISETRTDLLSNRIVLIAGPAASAASSIVTDSAGLRTLLQETDILAIGNPDTVPAGRYAVRALTAYDLYPLVSSKLALAGNVREVLQYVQNGSAGLGIVFATDVPTAPAGLVRQLFVFPDDAVGAPILYPVAVVSASKNRDRAAAMIEFLRGKKARDAFRSAGFILK
ncbi:MAG TPA: molybdate ABC transporter substrate-binding protein [Spirochaetia bacterium]|nr:molybdate ABC transporter substrate-binding protein [Spirochaetia bacterium]